MFKGYKNFGKEGLSVLFVCGIHGNETKAVKVIMKLREALEDKESSEFSGISSVGYAIGVNKEGLKHNTREWIDKQQNSTLDMNRSFEKETAIFEKGFDEIVDEVKEMTKNYDVVVDVHNSPNCVDSFLIDIGMPKSCWIAAFAKKMDSKIFQPIVRRSGVNSLKNYVNADNGTDHLHVGFTVEFGGMGFEGEHLDSEENINLKAYKLIEFLKQLPKLRDCVDEKLDYLDCTIPVFSTNSGIVEYEHKNPIGKYSKGEKICVIKKFSGVVVETIVAPCDGYLIGVGESYYVTNSIGEFQPFSKPEIFDKGL